MKFERVLVTGGGGFLGTHVVRQLQKRDVPHVSVPRSREWDLRRADQTEAVFAEARPDLVIHLAATVGGIGANRKRPGAFFYDNMAMGMNVLEQARRYRVKKLLLVGTVCAYPKFTPVPFREDDLWNGYPEETNAPYGVAKKALHVMANAYRAEYGMNMITIFPANLYGPGDHSDLETSHVIPALIRKFHEAQLAGESVVTLWGDGAPTREFLYVEDGARGLVDAAERYDEAPPVNLGTGDEISIKDVAMRISSLIGYRGGIHWDTEKPNGQPRRRLDVTRARTAFGFEARVSIDDGLQKTVAWYRSAGALPKS